jgi:hypothetical protein
MVSQREGLSLSLRTRATVFSLLLEIFTVAERVPFD